MFNFKTIFFSILIIFIIYLVFFRKVEHYIPTIVNNQSLMNISSLYNTKQTAVFDNLDVKYNITANDLIIDGKITLGNFDLNIDSSGTLIIKNNSGDVVWSSKKLIGSALYDPTGRYAFFVDINKPNSEGPQQIPCTYMYDMNVDGYGAQQNIPNIAFNGGITDQTGQYILTVNKEVWYQTPGIQLQDSYDISNNQWPIVDLGIKQGQLNYGNTFVIPIEYSDTTPFSGLALYYTGTSRDDPQLFLMEYKK
jgi:hypothetical protein